MHFIPVFARFGTLGLFPYWLRPGKLMRYRVETPSELLVHIWVILAEIQQEILNPDFMECMERLQK
jgi:hypothetical protein